MQKAPGPKAGGYGSRTTDGGSCTMLAPPEAATLGFAPTCGCALMRDADALLPVATLGFAPTCGCALMRDADALLPVATPIGGGPRRHDPTAQTGRGGFGRERGTAEGTITITRYQQRAEAAQLRESPHRTAMAAEAGTAAFSHYLRTDYPHGARAIPQALRETWQARGWLMPVAVPALAHAPAEPCLVLDPFCGSATTGVAALYLGQHFIGIDANAAYLDASRQRLVQARRTQTASQEEPHGPPEENHADHPSDPAQPASAGSRSTPANH